ncbi:MAG: hypothetical protein WKF84_21140 [Pyrinomonadaceae bacterium]
MRFEKASREIVMDERPELYRVMAEELQREKRVAEIPSGANVIADPRRYLYLEGYADQQEQQTTISFEVQLEENSPTLNSDHGDARLRIERGGYFRSTVLLPNGNSPTSISKISLRCYARSNAALGGSCQNVRLNKAFTLDDNYVPRLLSFQPSPAISLKPGEAATTRFGN